MKVRDPHRAQEPKQLQKSVFICFACQPSHLKFYCSIGIAFDLQIFDTIPKAPHDAKLDYIITETRILITFK